MILQNLYKHIDQQRIKLAALQSELYNLSAGAMLQAKFDAKEAQRIAAGDNTEQSKPLCIALQKDYVTTVTTLAEAMDKPFSIGVWELKSEKIDVSQLSDADKLVLKNQRTFSDAGENIYIRPIALWQAESWQYYTPSFSYLTEAEVTDVIGEFEMEYTRITKNIASVEAYIAQQLQMVEALKDSLFVVPQGNTTAAYVTKSINQIYLKTE
ncbi:TPA: hypothetical protein N5Y90_002455 [Vibrio cholerae]|nr:hypothetical protein [Vibrio cholerae]EJB5295505.1 hypothetical protein [Vibrio cholerae]ELJ8610538.1 hypothetical protein [Vibrio cholerae]ELJ8706333.1 hypothetical protein [Vibrio cholerae]ELK5327577.1 hypothetical protein [Vibrio cholerae]